MREPVFSRRETIYRGMGGRIVERVWTGDGASFILKQCGGDSGEPWVYEHILPLLPPVYPRLAASWNDARNDGTIWMLFEDIGPLRHRYEISAAREAVRSMAGWHSRPTGEWPELPSGGLKPGYDRMTADLLTGHRSMLGLIAPGGDPELYRKAFRLLERGAAPADGRIVFSHGDLHVGNYSLSNGRLYVLDWEHVHLNMRYWDLFHVIDLTHPLYPREDDPGWRYELLEAYLRESAEYGVPLDRRRFLGDYRWFAAVFSLWMLLLIRTDLQSGAGPWDTGRLTVQRVETERIFEENMAAFLAERQDA